MTAQLVPATTQAPCEVLFPLFTSAQGSANVGRMLKGVDSGRLVFLRETRAALTPGALAAVDVSRSLAHPHFTKLLGLVRLPEQVFVASEYIPGVSLFELSMSVREQRAPLSPAVAVHIARETLRAAAAARFELEATAGVKSVRCVFPDTIWIAEFGEVMLMEVGAAPFLTSASTEHSEQALARDLLATAIELFHLTSGKSISARFALELEQHVPPELAALLERAMGLKGNVPYATSDEFEQDLDNLPAQFQGGEGDLSEAIGRVIGPVLEARRRKLQLFELGAASQSQQAEDDDTTQIFRAVSSERGDVSTTRPPARDAANDRAPAPGPGGLALGSKVPRLEDLLRMEATEQAAEAVAARQQRPPGHAPTRLTRRWWWAVAVGAAIGVGFLRWHSYLP